MPLFLELISLDIQKEMAIMSHIHNRRSETPLAITKQLP